MRRRARPALAGAKLMHARREMRAMTLYASTLVLDATDIARATRFWSDALGYVTAFESPTFVSLKHSKDARRLRIGLQPADAPRPASNALHLDLATDDMAREAKRLEGLGATRVPDWPYGDDAPNWIVMRDPEGNEFCVVEHPREALLFHDGA